MEIDPILPLSISIAEGIGTYAVFLGSGASKEADIPTGGEILHDTLELLYKLKNNTEEVSDEEIEEWYNESELKGYNYSKILEELCPSREERRVYLEKHFINKKPTQTHHLIANMVKNGLIKIIITTNFDRLMEDALNSADVDYTIISSGEELTASHPREHSHCWLLKLHGDYKRLTIKNTTKELEKLDLNIESELQEIIDRYGIVVMGYSGSDEGVMSCFEKRNSKYTLYWLTRSEPTDRIKELIDKDEGRLIVRKSADNFLKELSSKIKIFKIHKTGETPEFLLNQVIQYLKDNDTVSIRETIKKEWKRIRDQWYEKYDNYQERSTESQVCLDEFDEYCNSITAIGLVLIEFDNNDFFDEIIKLLQKIYDLSTEIVEAKLEENSNISTNGAILDIPKGSIHNIYNCLGAYAIKEEKFDKLSKLFRLKIMDNPNTMEKKPIWSTDVFYPNTFGGDSSIVFDHLIKSYNNKDFLNEYFYSKHEFKNYLCYFNLLLCLYSTKVRLEYPKQYYEVLPNFSRVLNRDQAKKNIYRMRSEVISDKNLPNSFGETRKLFIENYPKRCENINVTINASRSTMSMYSNKLPCNLFFKLQ